MGLDIVEDYVEDSEDEIEEHNEFIYDVLPESGIRLLTIVSPAEDGKPLNCELRTYENGAPLQYFALSYCWGDARHKVEILINGAPFRITSNLDRLLRQTETANGLQRLNSEYRCIWADAICINQTSSDERSTQILRMNEIYANATCVIAWLGHYEDIDMKSFFRQMETVALLKHLLSSPDLKLETAFWDIIARPYWSRVWIVQELVVACAIEVWCGDCAIPFDAILGAIDLLQIEPQSLSRIFALGKMRGQYQARHPLLLLDCLGECSTSQASEERDRIYSLLSLCEDGKVFIPKPSYSLSLERVLMHMTLSYIAQRSLDVICLAGYVNTVDGRQSLNTPSWVPQFLNRSDWHGVQFVRFLNENGDLSLLTIGGSSTGVVQKPRSVFRLMPNQLQVEGLVVDQVFTVFDEEWQVPSQGFRSFDRQQWQAQLETSSSRINISSAIQCVTRTTALFGIDMLDSQITEIVSRMCGSEDLLSALDDFGSGHYLGDIDPAVYRFIRGYGINGERFVNMNEAMLPDVLFNFRGSCWFWLVVTFWVYQYSKRSFEPQIEGLQRGNQDKMRIQREFWALCDKIDVTNGARQAWTIQHGLVWTIPAALPGDDIAILRGCNVPVVVRPVEKKDIPEHRWPPAHDKFFRRPKNEMYWQVVGHAVVPGIMKGELSQRLDNEARPMVLV